MQGSAIKDLAFECAQSCLNAEAAETNDSGNYLQPPGIAAQCTAKSAGHSRAFAFSQASPPKREILTQAHSLQPCSQSLVLPDLLNFSKNEPDAKPRFGTRVLFEKIYECLQFQYAAII